LAESPEGESGSRACYARLPRRCRGSAETRTARPDGEYSGHIDPGQKRRPRGTEQATRQAQSTNSGLRQGERHRGERQNMDVLAGPPAKQECEATRWRRAKRGRRVGVASITCRCQVRTEDMFVMQSANADERPAHDAHHFRFARTVRPDQEYADSAFILHYVPHCAAQSCCAQARGSLTGMP